MIKAVIKGLQKKLNDLEKIIEIRQIYFNEQNELWKGTDKGYSYKRITKKLDVCRFNLYEVIDDLKIIEVK